MINERLARPAPDGLNAFSLSVICTSAPAERCASSCCLPRRQLLLASAGAAFVLWSVLATGGVMVNSVQLALKDQAVARERVRAERLVAERDARLRVPCAN
jgi:hypothetical protein